MLLIFAQQFQGYMELFRLETLSLMSSGKRGVIGERPSICKICDMDVLNLLRAVSCTEKAPNHPYRLCV